jgi:hypothetical protein
MTGLGAAIYGGFFVLAALWLFITADGPVFGDDQDQRPERSNSTSNSADVQGSSPWLTSQSSLK